MANIHIEIRTVRRAAGQRATGAAAYRAGERIRDERTGKLHNYSRRQDVTHKEIFLPSNLGEAPLAWARDRASLWNAAELAEKRGNSRVAREFQVSLPPELSPTQRLALARGFAREMSDRYGIAVDLAIHDPKPGGDPRNFHAHLLATTREVTAWGLGDKAGLDMHAVQRAKQGLSDHSEEYTAVRERWASHMNEAFREANIDLRVDHRTLAAQGIDRQPMVYVPMEFYRTQIKGLKPGQLERLREDYRARLAARRELAKQPVSENEPVASPERELDKQPVPANGAAAPLEKSIDKQPMPANEPIASLERSIDKQPMPANEPIASLEKTVDKQPMTVKEAIASLNDEIDKRPAPVKEPIAPPEKTIDPRNVEEIRKNAVQSWLRMRAREAEGGERAPDTGRVAGGDHDQVATGERDRSRERVAAGGDRNHEREGSREQGHDHNRDGDSPVSRTNDGYGDDVGM